VPRFDGVCVGEIDDEAETEDDTEGEELGVVVTVTDSVGPIKSVSVSTPSVWITGFVVSVELMPTITVYSEPEGTTLARFTELQVLGAAAMPVVRLAVTFVPKVAPPVTADR
jgi:hypothetical protein